MASVSPSMGRRSSSTTTLEPIPEPPKRVCDEADCDTLLSRYNEYDFCARHQPMIIPRLRGKVLND